MKQEKSCGAVIIKDKTVLIVHQQNDFWSFPKGHVEPNETEIETALREVKEETGLDITINPTTRYSFSYYIERLDAQKEVVLFLAQLKNPDHSTITKQDDEIAEFSWVPFDRVNNILQFDHWREAWRQIYAKLTKK